MPHSRQMKHRTRKERAQRFWLTLGVVLLLLAARQIAGAVVHNDILGTGGLTWETRYIRFHLTRLLRALLKHDAVISRTQGTQMDAGPS